MANVKKEKDMIKARLLVLAKMFYNLTDEENQWTNTEIMEYLEKHEVPANEKTLRGDIRLLQDMGFDVVTVVSRPNRYYQRNREFSLPELKILIDAVASSRFITTKKSRDLGVKLSELASENQRRELRRNVYATNRVKNSSEAVYGMVDTINEAINRHRTVTFQYREYTGDLKPVLRNNGEVYEISPYALYWNEDFYYVVGWSDKHGNVSSFRADRLVDPVITDRRAVKKPEDFNIDDYSRRIFEMFDGEPTVVTLECKNEFAKYIVDRFGTKLKTYAADEGASDDASVGRTDEEPAGDAGASDSASDGAADGSFRVDVEVSLSPTFYAWVFQFGGGIRILAPEKAVEEIAGMAKKILD